MTVATRQRLTLAAFLIPATAWLILFFVIPLLIVLLYSFLQRGEYGGISWQWTIEHYQRLSRPVFLGIMGRSIWLGLVTTCFCLLLGYPMAYCIATAPLRWRNSLLLLVVIPFWTNFLVRTYAWMVILRTEGLVNTALQSWQIIDAPLELLFTPFSVGLGLVYGYLPFMILPLYATIEKLDRHLIEAAQDLGANDIFTFFRVILPLTMRGIIAGSLLVFIPAVGAFITPDILGGAKTLMIGNLIENQFLKVRNWPFGSALSMLLIAVILIPVMIYFRTIETRRS